MPIFSTRKTAFCEFASVNFEPWEYLYGDSFVYLFICPHKQPCPRNLSVILFHVYITWRLFLSFLPGHNASPCRDKEGLIFVMQFKRGHNALNMYSMVVKAETYMSSWKSSKGRSPSLHLAKEGDFARNRSATLILSINIQIPAEILKMMWYSLLIMA